jgi:rhamnosyltransferase
MPASFINTITVKDIAGVVVLYNPDSSVVSNIHTYIHLVDHLFIFDNSASDNNELIQEILTFSSAFTYIPYHQNRGIATALNAGASAALIKGYSWLLTMDQDSVVDSQMIQIFINYINSHNSQPIGIVSPLHVDKNTVINTSMPAAQEELTVMTSGNLLNLKAFSHIGDFEEKLFIDYVDHEYCLRLKKNGYKIIQVNNAILYHNLGNISSTKVGSREIYYSNHSALRRYYITRNRLYVLYLYKKDFPSFYKKELASIGKEMIKILFFEDAKLQKVRSILKGVIHYRQGRFGKLE